MKIILPGGTCQIGNILTRHFLKSEYEVVILSRSPDRVSYFKNHPFSHRNVSIVQ